MPRRLLASLIAMALSGACSDTAPTPIDVSSDPGAAERSWFDAERSERIDRFRLGGGTGSPVVDVLFVLDPSVSMGRVRDRVRAGFAALADDPDLWPDKVRIGVMMAIPTRPWPRGERIVDPAVLPGAWSHAFPGTHGLVDATGIAAAHEQARSEPPLLDVKDPREAHWRSALHLIHRLAWSDIEDPWPHPGCDAWFRPEDVDASGTPCLVAHTWIPETRTGVETGLRALQGLADDPDGDWFRPGAVANIVFVSDTHDPGMPARHLRKNDARRRLLREPVALEHLVRTVLTRQPLAGLRMHAIAPATPCVEDWSPLGATYEDAANLTGGQVVDLCTTEDYTPLIRWIARDGAVPMHAVVPLGSPATRMVEATVDGESAPLPTHTDRVATLDVDLDTPHEVDLRYRVEDLTELRRLEGATPRTAPDGLQ